MDNLGRSLLARYRVLCGRTAELPEDGYRGEYMIELARDFRAEVGDRYADSPEEEALPVFRKEAGDRILRGIRDDLASFRVTYDRWFAERELHDRGLVAAALADLRERGQLYESDGATYFRSQALGDEKDRVLVRADGRTTYFAADVAYHRHKLREGFSRMIDIWGADHHGYVREAARGASGARGRREPPGGASRPVRHPDPRREGGPDVDPVGGIHDAARSPRRGRGRRRAVLLPAAQFPHPPGLRPHPGEDPVAEQPGLLHPVRPRPDLLHFPRGGSPGERRSPDTRPFPSSPSPRRCG